MKSKTRVYIPPPVNLDDYGPSALFRFFIEAGDWDQATFADDISDRHPPGIIGTDAVSDWANEDVVPKRYRAALYRLIEDLVEKPQGQIWKESFQKVWAEQRALKKKRQHSHQCENDIRTVIIFVLG